MNAWNSAIDPSYPDIEADFEFGPDFDYLTFECPWGCMDKKGIPHKHRHGTRGYAGGPIIYGGRTSHCRQSGAPSGYRLVPRTPCDPL